MNRCLLHMPVWPVLLALALAGCGAQKPAAADGEHAHDEAHEHAGDAASVQFKEDAGLLLPAETAAALGLKTATVTERVITGRFEVTASVFDPGPPARASSIVPAAVADELARHPPVEATVLAVRRDLSPALNQVEIVLALPGTPAAGSTVTLQLSGSARTSPAVPRSAVLRSAAGTFVYRVNESHLLRAPVRTGADDGEYCEILDGLHTGDVVATTAVEQLWLTELHLTKGGGHSH